MKKKSLFVGMPALALVFGLVLAGCDMFTDADDSVSFTTGTVTTLTADAEAGGDITSSNREQWFKFTAGASTQYITFTYETLDSLSYQLYDRDGNTVGSQIYGARPAPPYTGLIFTNTVTKGKVYYIKVTSSVSGTYKIVFSNSELTLESRTGATVLTSGAWVDDEITDSGQTYKFTATASKQYIHVKYGTLKDLYVRFYDGDGMMLFGYDEDVHLSGISTGSTGAYIWLTVTTGKAYYIRVFCSANYSGNYKIAFNTSETAPSL
jgi:hypothetical protein